MEKKTFLKDPNYQKPGAVSPCKQKTWKPATSYDLELIYSDLFNLYWRHDEQDVMIYLTLKAGVRTRWMVPLDVVFS